jgi:hypothetical protein
MNRKKLRKIIFVATRGGRGFLIRRVRKMGRSYEMKTPPMHFLTIRATPAALDVLREGLEIFPDKCPINQHPFCDESMDR